MKMFVQIKYQEFLSLLHQIIEPKTKVHQRRSLRASRLHSDEAGPNTTILHALEPFTLDFWLFFMSVFHHQKNSTESFLLMYELIFYSPSQIIETFI